MMRVGIDTGGTFTDFIFYDGGRITVHKVLSTSKDPSQAILEGIGEVLGNGIAGVEIVHGTTVATNALLERKGARIALVTTKGFEDVIEIGRQNRGSLYDLLWERAEPLVSRGLRFGISERVNHRGEVLAEINPHEIDALLVQLRRLNLEGVAVSFLHSYANPKNEEAATKLLAPLGVPISVSSRILPEFREYERTSTVAANSYLAPKVKSYMDALCRNLPDSNISIMQSSGGLISPHQAGDEPVRIVLSGPAGGVVGAFKAAKAAGFHKALTYDMGGTSTDIALLDGAVRFTTETSIGGVPIRVPMIDVATIGAGGGSIARIDSGGALKVGPESAGADPGPACYGRGTLATVTDANLFLGRINPSRFLGGRMKIHPERAESVIHEMAMRANLPPKMLAEGIISVANANMERALRVISIGRGFDPREFALVSFGGAGGLHASDIAVGLGIQTVIFPQNPGALSALGMLLADSFRDYSLTVFLDGGDFGAIEEGFEHLHKRALADSMGRQVALKRFLDVRYRRQSHEITISYSKRSALAFHRAHRKLYGYAKPKGEVEIVTLRLRAIEKKKKFNIPRLNKPPSGVSSHLARIFYGGGEIDARSFARAEFFSGFGFRSPAIIYDDTSTIFIPPGFECDVDGFGNILARV
ncbi:MAG: hydantoinase/oxoprolinase family protein [Deltaproteobacteria bacterium]